MNTFSRTIELPVSAEAAFDWHEREGAFVRLTPPWEKVELIDAQGGIRDGAHVEVRVSVAGKIGFKALYRHADYKPGEQFVDLQEKGPFRSWRHEHLFHTESATSCKLEDRIVFEPPLFSGPIVLKRLESMFRYRHDITEADLAYERTHGPVEAKTVLVSGATGLVGRALCARLTTRGHTVKRLSRRTGGIRWNPAQGELDEMALDGVDAVIHLAGEPIAQRWSAAARKRILESRVESSRLLVNAILKSEHRPSYISASGINVYGSVNNDPVHEQSEPGEGFLAEVCRAWESEAKPLIENGVRSVFMRTGIVLSPAGGALAKMLPVFKAGAGGCIGSGRQKMSWIVIDDLVELYLRAVEDGDMSGPVNAVSPEPVDNRTFTKTLGRILNRPTLLPVPRLALKTLLGDMADETVLSDLNVEPRYLQSMGHLWRYPDLESALRHVLGRT